MNESKAEMRDINVQSVDANAGILRSRITQEATAQRQSKPAEGSSLSFSVPLLMASSGAWMVVGFNTPDSAWTEDQETAMSALSKLLPTDLPLKHYWVTFSLPPSEGSVASHPQGVQENRHKRLADSVRHLASQGGSDAQSMRKAAKEALEAYDAEHIEAGISPADQLVSRPLTDDRVTEGVSAVTSTTGGKRPSYGNPSSKEANVAYGSIIDQEVAEKQRIEAGVHGPKGDEEHTAEVLANLNQVEGEGPRQHPAKQVAPTEQAYKATGPQEA